MNLRVSPHPLSGTVERVVSSKSQAHRALICAALSREPTALGRVDLSDDIAATVRCLRALGAQIVAEGDVLRVQPLPRPASGALLDCGESGSTLRFLLPLAAALGADCAFTGRGKLSQRPLSPLYEQLAGHGARLSPQGVFPLSCAGRLRGGVYTLAGNVSSQFISGLLMALPLLPEDSSVALTGPLESAPYVDMTLDMLRRFGARIAQAPGRFDIPGGQSYRSPGALAVEGDWSGAAFWLAAGALSERGVACKGLNPDSAQGDRAILTILRRFGARVETDGGTVSVRKGELRGVSLDAADIPDLVPVLSVVAGAAAGETRIRSVARLRLKESDRVESVLALLRVLGVPARAENDALIISGRGRLTGGTADSFRDHRIALAAAVAATAADGPVTILDAQCADKSYPGFFTQFAALGGLAEEETDAV